MKQKKLKTILGTTLVLSAIANSQANVHKKIKKPKAAAGVVFKIQDRTNDQSSVTDGSKTERVSK